MREIDQAKMEAFMRLAQGHLTGAATMAMAYLGDRLGLYRALAEQGPATSAELASRTRCAERYVREWLAQQAAAGYLIHDPATNRYTLPAEHAMALAIEDSPAAFGGGFEINAGWYNDLDALEAAFRSGTGVSWSDHDQRVHSGTARFFGAAYHAFLLSEWAPALGLDSILKNGAHVADIGCGHGESTILLAQAYGASRFAGFDAHEASIEAARAKAAQAGVADRVRFEVGAAETFDGGPYDVIWFFDSFHDLGDPIAAASHARSQLSEAGTLALVEPFAYDDPHQNITENQEAALSYAASTLLCVPHSLSESGQAALGAQAGGRAVADVLRKGGLTQTRRVHVTPIHAVYAARP